MSKAPASVAAPVVSVLMTAYNREDYIGEAIESVLASSLENLELIVVDDGSADGTLDIAKRFSAKDARVKVHFNSQNLGDYPNRNRAASLAKGKYLKYLDSDDLIYPHGLQAMVSLMELCPQAGFGLAQTALADKPHPQVFSPREAYLEHFFRRDLFGRAPGSSIIRNAVFKESGGFTGVRQVGDHEYWMILSRRYPMATLPRDLVWDRTHGAQESFYDNPGVRQKMHLDVDIAALEHPDCPLTQDEKARALKRLEQQSAKTFWRLLLRERSPSKAAEYRQAMGLGLTAAFRSLR